MGKINFIVVRKSLRRAALRVKHGGTVPPPPVRTEVPLAPPPPKNP